MAIKNYDPTNSSAEPPHETACPKCGIEMEPIETDADGLPMQKLQLCPGCYLVTWQDQSGIHVRQGIPVKNGVDPGLNPGNNPGNPATWFASEPSKC